MVVVALLLSFLLITILISTLRFGISPMPSSRSVHRVLLQWIPEDFSGRIVDLGCGWGNLLWFCRRFFPKARLKGIEGSIFPFLVSKFFSFFQQTSIEYGNFFSLEFPNAEIFLCYLCPYGMANIKEQLIEQLKKGASVICVDFAIPGVPPTKEEEVGGFVIHKVYLYSQSGMILEPCKNEESELQEAFADFANREKL